LGLTPIASPNRPPSLGHEACDVQPRNFPDMSEMTKDARIAVRLDAKSFNVHPLIRAE
jgi:hypothetical protein